MGKLTSRWIHLTAGSVSKRSRRRRYRRAGRDLKHSISRGKNMHTTRIILSIIAVALFAGSPMADHVRDCGPATQTFVPASRHHDDFSEKDEVTRTFKLSPG